MVIRSLQQPTSILPLVVFRVMFGVLMFASTLRFILNGWVQTFYIDPVFHFTFYGFEWVRPLPASGMALVFALLLLTSLMIAVGAYYRVAIVVFFVLFSYVELIDKAYYLNHYYLVMCLSFLLMFLPAHRAVSMDVWRNPSLKTNLVPRWTIVSLKLMLAIVYVYAGLAKLQSDWLLHAQPIAIWLRPHAEFPILGEALFSQRWFAYGMSWFGAVYDLIIVFFLLWRRTRWLAFGAVAVFHLATGFFFPIGMFPYVMIGCTLIFFDAEDWGRVARFWGRLQGSPHPYPSPKGEGSEHPSALWSRGSSEVSGLAFIQSLVIPLILSLFFAFQLLFPLRFMLYPDNVLWTQEGFRFGWRVMLAENTGSAIFMVQDANGRSREIYPSQYLTLTQERQMSFQPDMILEFAHFLTEQARQEGMRQPMVFAEVYASVNGRRSQMLIDPTIDLAAQRRSLLPQSWILPFNQ